jgi:hypothetical protein
MIYQIINRLKEYIKRTDCTPNTLLTIPIHNGLEIELYLLQVFVDPRIFINLSFDSRREIIEFLLGYGAKINDVNGDGMNVLDYAYHVHDNMYETLKYPKYDHERMIKFLELEGAKKAKTPALRYIDPSSVLYDKKSKQLNNLIPCK